MEGGVFRGTGGLGPQLLSPLHESAVPREKRNHTCTRKTPPPSFLRNPGHFKLQHRATGARHGPTSPGADLGAKATDDTRAARKRAEVGAPEAGRKLGWWARTGGQSVVDGGALALRGSG